jgi:uncharacterized membrane protein required for colicin V production
MTENQNPSGKLARGIFSFFTISLAVVFMALSFYSEWALIPGALALIFHFGLSSSRKGLIAEIAGISRFFVAIFLGFLFSEMAGNKLGLSGISSLIAGFYAIFFVSYWTMGFAIKKLLVKDKTPGTYSKIGGFILGSVEGIIYFIFLLYMFTLVPGYPLAKSAKGFTQSTTKLAESIAKPFIPKKASGTIEMLKIASKMQNGIDPQKIDRRKLQRLMKPVQSLPEVRAITNNPKIMDLVRKRDVKALMATPEIKKLLNSPQLKQKLGQINWQEMGKTISAATKN